jgi:hypothetical protein
MAVAGCPPTLSTDTSTDATDTGVLMPLISLRVFVCFAPTSALPDPMTEFWVVRLVHFPDMKEKPDRVCVCTRRTHHQGLIQ